jgi:hypothetical protein
MKLRYAIIASFALLALLLTMTSAFALPTGSYPYSNYGYHYRYYDGPWGERMVYGGYGYFPNWNGQRPYGYRTYGSIYTPWDIRTNYMGPQPWRPY